MRIEVMLGRMLVMFSSAAVLSFQSGDPRPRSPLERGGEREAMVRTLQAYEPRVVDERVLRAMRGVPRHWFVPERERKRAYDDSPLSIGHGQTISQPYIVALMTQLAAVEPGMKVLEVGSGSGYQAAVLSQLTDRVFTIEILRPLAEMAGKALSAPEYRSVHAKTGDGYYGWPEEAPFDRILVTAAATHVPPPLLKQLRPGGRMVIPVGPRWGTQRLLLVTKKESGDIRTETLLPVVFVPLVGGQD